jgi:hypothetical protein
LIAEAREFLGKFKGMVLASALFFAVIQGMIGYMVSGTGEQIKAIS